ncbi:MAG: hypothetical protein HC875_29075 [Anaerolineales bacterium]|nr:hypothetical protein [Anaerolineales bacterium]
MIVAVGIAYMAWVGRLLLPAQWPVDYLEKERQAEEDLVGVYRLDERLFRVRVPVGSALNGKSLAENALRERYNLTVVAIERNGQVTLSPPPSKTVQQGDIILFAGNLEELRQRDAEPYFEILPSRDWREEDLESAAIIVVETVLAPRSRLIGQTLRQAHFREKYGMTALALWRGGHQRRTGLADLPLQFGDALLLQGPRERVQVLHAEPDLIVLGNGPEEARLVPGKGRLALIIMATTLALATLNSALVAEVILGGALLMVWPKC